MSEINHEREFSPENDHAKTANAIRLEDEAIARCFLSPDGKTALRILRREFGLGRLCFVPNGQGRYDYLAAAVTDGQRSVMARIEGALVRSRPHDPEVKDKI